MFRITNHMIQKKEHTGFLWFPPNIWSFLSMFPKWRHLAGIDGFHGGAQNSNAAPAWQRCIRVVKTETNGRFFSGMRFVSHDGFMFFITSFWLNSWTRFWLSEFYRSCGLKRVVDDSVVKPVPALTFSTPRASRKKNIEIQLKSCFIENVYIQTQEENHQPKKITTKKPTPVKTHRQVIGRLPTHGDHHTPGILQLTDVHDPFLATGQGAPKAHPRRMSGCLKADLFHVFCFVFRCLFLVPKLLKRLLILHILG